MMSRWVGQTLAPGLHGGDVVQDGCELQLPLARNANALEAEFGRLQRHSRVEAHLCGGPMACGGVELRSLRVPDYHKITVGLEAGRDRPFHLGRIVDVY